MAKDATRCPRCRNAELVYRILQQTADVDAICADYPKCRYVSDRLHSRRRKFFHSVEEYPAGNFEEHSRGKRCLMILGTNLRGTNVTMIHTYDCGINLGGWISQYRQDSVEHFDSFIQRTDIAQIASWGMDHVQVPVDYPIIEDDTDPGQYKESGLQYIDRCLDWCDQHGLVLILDLHRAPGYSFGTLESNTLFDSPADQDRLHRTLDLFGYTLSTAR